MNEAERSALKDKFLPKSSEVQALQDRRDMGRNDARAFLIKRNLCSAIERATTFEELRDACLAHSLFVPVRA